MNLLNILEKKLRRFTLPNVTAYLIAGQVFFFLAWKLLEFDLETIVLVPQKVLDGEVWRLVTFAFTPPTTYPIFALFAWYIFYLMGTSLERFWGVTRYNIYLLIAYVASVTVSFIIPNAATTNVYIGVSVWLAFAFLNPEFRLYLFFFFPVKIKWLALITWIGYFFALIFGTWLDVLLAAASVVNFFLFFHADILRKMKAGRKHMKSQAKTFAGQNEPFHVCTVCGITDRTHPEMDFRYCPDCNGTHGYCREHISNHEHIASKDDPNKQGFDRRS